MARRSTRLSQGLTFGASWDSIFHNDVLRVGTVDTATSRRLPGILSYKVTDKLTFNGRAEYATVRLGGLLRQRWELRNAAES